jgi:hypothetical protein
MSALAAAATVTELRTTAALWTKIALSELAELAPVVPAKARIYHALRCHDLDGRGYACPSVAMLAREVKCTRRHAFRALSQLEADGFVERERRHTPKGYPTSSRFRVKRPGRGSDIVSHHPGDTASHPQGETNKRNKQKESKKGKTGFGCALVVPAQPPEAPPESPDPPPAPEEVAFDMPSVAEITPSDPTPEIVADSHEAAPEARPPGRPKTNKPINDPVAYFAAIKQNKRRPWLHDKLNPFVGRYFAGDFEQQMRLWELVARAADLDRVGKWELLPKADRKTLDWLDEQRRAYEAQGGLR